MSSTPLRRTALLAIDLLLLAIAWLLAYLLRNDFTIPSYETGGDDYRSQALLLLPWVIGLHVVLFYVFHLYRGIVRFVSTGELKAICLASIINVLFWALFNAWVEGQETFLQLPLMDSTGGGYHVMRIPRGVLAIYLLTSIFLAGGFRFSRRLWAESRIRIEDDAPATLIVGAGGLAERALREIMSGETARYRPVCAVSPTGNRLGSSLHGIRVKGLIKDIPTILHESDIKVVLIALDENDPALLREIVAHCQSAKVSFFIIPTMQDITSGRVDIRPTRRVEVEDLLGREPVRLELPQEKNYLRGETVLISGAGGSIGRELSRQVAWAKPRKIVLLGKGENSIHDVQQEIAHTYREIELVPIIGDIRDESAMFRLFEEHRPTIVFHAAAHKHVTLMENEPDEAIKNNVLGTAILAYLADKYQAKRFILISSDKAVRPASVMGATKRLAEMVVFSIGEDSTTTYQAVRFGNVLGSRGSVIPTFQKQIARGGPITVTHPDVTRFFMTIPEAVSLVIHCGTQQAANSLFLLDMGQPIRILDIVKNLITLSGLQEGSDIEIKYTGLRPGEKLHEELLTQQEGAVKTEIGKVWVTQPRSVVAWSEMQIWLKKLRVLAEEGTREEILAWMADVIPDFHPASVREKTDDEALRPARERAERALDEAALSARNALGMFAGAELLQGDLFGEEAPAPEPATESDAQTEDNEEYSDENTAIPDLFAEVDAFLVQQSLTPEGAGAQDNAPEKGAPESEATNGPADEQQIPEPQANSAFDALDALIEQEAAAQVGDAPVDTHSNDSTETEPAVRFLLDEESPEITPTEEPDNFNSLKEEEMSVSSSPAAATGRDVKAEAIPCVFFALLEGAPASLKADFLNDLARKLDANSSLLLVGADLNEVPAGLRDRTKVMPAAKSTVAQWNEAIRACPAGALLISAGATIRFADNFLQSLRQKAAANPEALIIYANHTLDKGGKKSEQVLHDHEGCPHERFDFGQVLAYRADAVREAGLFDESLQHAWEYDMHLKLMEKGNFQRIASSVYTVVEPAAEETKSGALYSPGRGKLGGFSYVFYPEDVEREVTTVFEKALKRWGAWIDHDSVPVPQPKEKPEVMGSVVIPVLNRRRFIGNAIEKVLQGTYRDIEVIVIDNGSTDGTQDVVQEIAKRDNRVRLLKGTGSSIASALNDGIRAARGKYICQLDSDDEYVPVTLERMLNHLESHPKCGLAISYYRLIDEGGTVIEDVAPITHSGYTRNQILRRDGAGALRVFPKAVLEEFGYYDEQNYGNFGEDYDMVLKTGEKYDVDRVHDVLYHYRRHGDNTDVIRDPEMKYKNKNNARQQALRRRIAINRKLGKKA